LKYDTLPVGKIRRVQAKLILDKIGETKGEEKWTANNYNYHRAHLQMLFTTLVEYQAVETNWIDDIKRRKGIKKFVKLLPKMKEIQLTIIFFSICTYSGDSFKSFFIVAPESSSYCASGNVT
jgi:hypothetical protein